MAKARRRLNTQSPISRGEVQVGPLWATIRWASRAAAISATAATVRPRGTGGGLIARIPTIVILTLKAA